MPSESSAYLVHGENLSHKESNSGKYTDTESKRLLSEIRAEYDLWVDANAALVGPTADDCGGDDGETIEERTKLLVDYKDFIDQQHYAEHFDSRSNLHSSVIEEFLFYLFRDLVDSFGGDPLIGKSDAFKDLFFVSSSFSQMLDEVSFVVEVKDHDFTIGAVVEGAIGVRGAPLSSSGISLEIPALAIECKTYLDKTMLEGSSTAAEQLKTRNPNAQYMIVAEWLKLTEAVNLRKYAVDQIYVLRRQKNTDRELRYADTYDKKPIDSGVIWHLFKSVRDHLVEPWGGTIAEGLNRGWLID
jgi:hypothetical protein